MTLALQQTALGTAQIQQVSVCLKGPQERLLLCSPTIGAAAKARRADSSSRKTCCKTPLGAIFEVFISSKSR